MSDPKSKIQKNRMKPLGSGRAKGTPNKKTESLLEVCDRMGVNPFEGLLQLTKSVDESIRLGALKEACKYLYSQRRAVEVTGADQGPVEIKSRYVEEYKTLLETGLNERRRV